MDLRALVERRLVDAGAVDLDVDVVAVGKASREMAGAVRAVLGRRVRRQLIVVDVARSEEDVEGDVVVGEHPIPGPGSLVAGERLVEFLGEPSDAACTLFLVSGGASSLCAVPEEPLTLAELHELWMAALAAGLDITTLNRLRAATSAIAGGAVLRRVRTPRSCSLVMVDNVLSGPRWVASGLTYDYSPTRSEVEQLVSRVGRTATALESSLLEAFERRAVAMAAPITTDHVNLVVAEPSMLLALASGEAARRGYRVVELGSAVQGDVADAVTRFSEVLRGESATDDRLCVIGVGEVTVRVLGSGTGGRCQEFAWRMADELADLGRDGVVVARASDGRDFVAGVAGAWVDERTTARAAALGLDWRALLDANDSHRGLERLQQLIGGAPTGWNLCDLYVALRGPTATAP